MSLFFHVHLVPIPTAKACWVVALRRMVFTFVIMWEYRILYEKADFFFCEGLEGGGTYTALHLAYTVTSKCFLIPFLWSNTLWQTFLNNYFPTSGEFGGYSKVTIHTLFWYIKSGRHSFFLFFFFWNSVCPSECLKEQFSDQISRTPVHQANPKPFCSVNSVSLIWHLNGPKIFEFVRQDPSHILNFLD